MGKKRKDANQPLQKKRKWWFRVLKNIMKIRYKKPTFQYLGEELDRGAVILSNHEGTDAPMAMEIYMDKPMRMWGAHEMNSGLIKLYKYQTRIYYHEKKHWNLHLARLFCIIASPLTYLFYSGLNLISTYRDSRLRNTIKESNVALEEGHNIIIYPERSDKGYLAELEGFHSGFALLADSRLKKGKDTKIFVTYYRKSDNTYIIDAPVMYSELVEKFETREALVDSLRLRCNELGKMAFGESVVAEEELEEVKQEQE